jgi:hypothetical protein
VFLRRLTLSDFRNYAELEIEPATGLNVFVGDNAQGKSNLLEGIAMLGTGKSFRTSRDADTVRQGFSRAVLYGEAAMRAGSVDLTCTIERGGRGTQKTYTVNGAVRYAIISDGYGMRSSHRPATRGRTAQARRAFPTARFPRAARLLPRAGAVSKALQQERSCAAR